jgi:TatD DNase family protein
LFIDIHTHRTIEEPDVISVQSLYADFGQTQDGRRYSIGVHPCYMTGYERLLSELEQYGHLPNVLAIGECGLDTICSKDAELQGEVFRQQVTVANRVKKPLIIHCVRAFDELLQALEEIKPSVPVIMHGYNKKGTVAQRLLTHNIYLSFGAAIMNAKSPAAAVLKDIPADQFFLETDDATVSIKDVYRCATAIRQTGMESLTLQLEQNFRNVFKYQL